MQIFRRTKLALAALLCVVIVPMTASAKTAAEIDAGVTAALEQLYQINPTAKTLSSEAKGILVFPNVLKAGFIIGGSGGTGALRVDGKTIGYFQTASGSLGLQAGVESRKEAIMFMTQEALDNFLDSSNWQAGVDGSISVIQSSVSGSASTKTLQQPIVGFIFGSEGLYGGLNFEGAKISRYTPE